VRHLSQDVDAAIDDSYGVEAEGNNCVLIAVICKFPGLAREEVCKCRTVVTAVGFGPDAKLVVLGLIFRESSRTESCQCWC
jgi:hypothetical protein